MADNTDRFGLNTYSQGDTNWDHTDTVQTIDELAIERGAAADRPDSGDYDDELYLATDQQILYRWDVDATNWIVEGVGSETDPLPKVWANEIDVETLEADGAVIGDTYHYASRYDGEDADARLDNAISAASEYDTIFLENESYSADRTLNKRLKLIGTTGWAALGDATHISGNATWTIDERSVLDSISTQTDEGVSIIVNDFGCKISNGRIRSTEIEINDNACCITEILEGNVTFASGTDRGIVDSCSDTTVTDNGSNTVGDIA